MTAIRAIVPFCVALLCGACAHQRRDSNPVPDPEPLVGELEDLAPKSGEEALAWLMAGNHRFWDGHPRHSHETVRRAVTLRQEQHPFAVVLGCADSRVPPELVFDHGLGDLFVIRVAGNVVADDEAGSIEYAMAHLGIPLVVVLGHERCGAVTAALHADEENPQELVRLIARIKPALAGVPADLPEKERIHVGVEANTSHSVRQLRAIAERVRGPEGTKTTVVGAIYELDSGRVRLLED